MNQKSNQELIKFISKQIADYLRQEIAKDGNFLDNAYTRTRYNYPSPQEEVQHELQELANQHPFERQASLKRIVGPIDNENIDELRRKWTWVVNIWGGINTYNVENRIQSLNQMNPIDVNVFLIERLHTLDAISSISKIAAFTQPSEWFVYDSRVTYVLDWLLHKYTNQKLVRYFQIPSSRGKNNRKKNIDTLISNITYFENDRCYDEYCKLVKGIAKEFPWGEFSIRGKQPCKIEMILFALGKNRAIIDSEINAQPQNNPQPATPSPKPASDKAHIDNSKPDWVKTAIKKLEKGFQGTDFTERITAPGRKVYISTMIEKDGHKFGLYVGQSGEKIFCSIIAQENGVTPPYADLFNDKNKGGNGLKYHATHFTNPRDAVNLMKNVLRVHYNK